MRMLKLFNAVYADNINRQAIFTKGTQKWQRKTMLTRTEAHVCVCVRMCSQITFTLREVFNRDVRWWEGTKCL